MERALPAEKSWQLAAGTTWLPASRSGIEGLLGHVTSAAAAAAPSGASAHAQHTAATTSDPPCLAAISIEHSRTTGVRRRARPITLQQEQVDPTKWASSPGVGSTSPASPASPRSATCSGDSPPAPGHARPASPAACSSKRRRRRLQQRLGTERSV